MNQHLGTAIFSENEPRTVRVIGIHNDTLRLPPRYDTWRFAEGYQFQAQETMILNIRPGESDDTQLVGRQEVYSVDALL